ncbi:DUF4159 domain-containing protein [Acidobacteria bacterium AH-259-G07]|nr:DUF4159 domain-containing protein [Acidobacteria bacterium AH-259-L09]MDA2925924.1 DUF4159 domain-containing protein [Acidobacteria bacterium AH-259-G07]
MRRILGLLLTPLCLWGVLIPALGLDDVNRRRDPKDPNLFQFVRIRYNGYTGFWGSRRWVPPWMHDYPRAEKNFLKILLELTSIETTPDSYLILDLNDPEIMNYPILYVSEPGYWEITKEEAANLREYLSRGGFVIFDDFRSTPEWTNLTACMKEVFPDRSFQELTLEHPVFHCFYDIETLDMIPPYVLQGQGKPSFRGMFDENGRLQVIANYNNDIGDYWEWSDDSLTPVNLSNEAFKFGINYIIYGMTH